MSQSVAICIITCFRPTALRRLLDSLVVQKHIPDSYQIRIVIVDNDMTGENRKVFDCVKDTSPFEVIFAEEPERGIPYARNKAVEMAWGDDALIFVDDDEVVPKHWLQTLLSTWEETKADIVTGPVTAILPDHAPAWAKKSGTYNDHRCFPTGTQLDEAYTNNVLISQKVFRAFKPAFDPFFRYIGAGDSHFSRRAVRQGFTIVWCAEAEVQEIVPSSRITFSWLLKRSFRNGSCDTICNIRIDPSPKTYLKVLIYSGKRFFYGTVLLFKGTFFGSWNPFIKGIRLLVSSAGTFLGIFGIKHNEYKTIHRS